MTQIDLSIKFYVKDGRCKRPDPHGKWALVGHMTDGSEVFGQLAEHSPLSSSDDEGQRLLRATAEEIATGDRGAQAVARSDEGSVECSGDYGVPCRHQPLGIGPKCHERRRV